MKWDWMIGRFVYMRGVPAGLIAMELLWQGDEAMARVCPPPSVVDMMRDHHVNVREDDEFMSLPIALSYAVLIATLSGTGLILTGDRKAWPVEWGTLMDMHPVAVRARSH